MHEETSLAAYKAKAMEQFLLEIAKPPCTFFRSFNTDLEKQTLLNRFLLSSLLYFVAFLKRKRLVRESMKQLAREPTKRFHSSISNFCMFCF